MLKLEHPTKSVVLIAPQVEELTAANAANFRQSLLDVIEGGNTRIVIDLAKVIVVDSSGIGALVAVMKRIGLRGDLALFLTGDLAVAGDHADVEAIRITLIL